MAAFHKICWKCLDNKGKEIDRVVYCLHCMAEVQVPGITCGFCCREVAMKLCETCGNLICGSCFDLGCKFCFCVSRICASCKIFCHDILLGNCGHTLCEDCYDEGDGICLDCYNEKVCELCQSYTESTKPRLNQKRFCNNCYEKYKETILNSKSTSFHIQNPKSQDTNYPEESKIKSPDSKVGTCAGCGNLKPITSYNCQHTLCDTCLLKPCYLCGIIKNEANPKTKPSNTNLENCFECGKYEKLEKTKCEHKRCKNCLNKECIMCIAIGNIDQKPQNNKKKEPAKVQEKNIAAEPEKPKIKIKIKNRKDNLGDCETCNKTQVIVKYNGCYHLRCNSCINLQCRICNPDKCASCNLKTDMLNMHDCGQPVCGTCETYRCLICDPYEFCSNCGEQKDGKTVGCGHYMCDGCFNLVENDRCVFHDSEIKRCTNHGICKFIVENEAIVQLCSKKKYCLYCKKFIHRNSETKKHRKCKNNRK